MNKIKLGMIFFMAVVLFAVVSAYAQSENKLQLKEVKQKAVSVQSKDKVEPASIPQRPAFTDSKQGYQMLTDVLDGFGGASASTNYKIPVNSGGQPSTIGIIQSTNYKVSAGYVHASFVNRGDVNVPGGDGIINSADVVFLLNYLYKHGPEPCPMEAGDVTCDGVINSADVVFLLNYLYKGGPPPCNP